MNVYLPFIARLPSAYQEVEYIESSGGEYINTGWQPTSSPKIDIDFMFLGGNSNTWCPIFGRRGVNTDNIGLYIQSSSLYVSPNYAGFDPGTSSGLTISKNVKYNIVNDKGQFYIDGVYKSACSTTNTLTQVSYQLYLFDNNIQGTPQGRNTQMRLYSCKLYDSNTLVRNLIPCYRISDSVIGLYDLVNNQFYTNSGTGTFSKGNDVTMVELQNAYIGGEVWEPDATRTMLYLKFENNLTDSSGNNQSVSGAGIGYGTTGNKYYVERTGSASGTYINPPQTLMQGIGSGDFTISLWVWCVEGSGAWIFTNEYDSSSPWYGLYIKGYTNSLDNSKINLGWANNGGGGPSDAASCYAEGLNRYAWNHMIVTRNSGIISLYVNGQNYGDVSMTRSFANPGVSKFKILNRNDYTSQAWAEAGVRMSEVILEKVGWATEKCVGYFNSTKSNYGF